MLIIGFVIPLLHFDADYVSFEGVMLASLLNVRASEGGVSILFEHYANSEHA